MRILVLAQNLTAGGALRQLSMLAPQLEARGHEVALVALEEMDPDWRIVWGREAEVLSRDDRLRVRGVLAAARRLRRRLRDDSPDILYAYHGNVARVVSWLATRGAPTTLVWGQRGAGRRFRLRDDVRRAVPFVLARAVSGSIPLLISNSDAGRRRREASGFRCRRRITIPNGFDTQAFRPDAQLRARVRAEWGVADGDRLVGICGRIDPANKRHDVFLLAAARLPPDVRFVVVGAGPQRWRTELAQLAGELGIAGRLTWAGFRADMPAVYNALDVLCSASLWEGMPNAVGEAMSCGVPCVVTDTGDSAVMVGDAGVVVPAGDAEALADGIGELLQCRLSADDVRGAIAGRFTISQAAERTEHALRAAAGSSRQMSSTAGAGSPEASAPRARSRP